MADLSLCIQLRPDYSTCYIRRGLLSIQKRDYKQAVADTSKAIEIRPDAAEMYYDRGLARLALLQDSSQGKQEREQIFNLAFIDFGKAIELAKDPTVKANAEAVLKAMPEMLKVLEKEK